MKKLLKSSFSIFLALAIVFSSAIVGLNEIDFNSLLTVKASAVESGSCGNYLTWSLADDGTLTISGTGAMYDYDSSGSSIAPWLKSETTDVRKVVINSGVTTIGKFAFYECDTLSTIAMPNTLTTIGHGVFWGCCALKSITIPDSVNCITGYAFYDCDRLASITIPDSVTKLGWSVFYDCAALKSVTIGDGVTTIDEKSFYSCDNLESITIGTGVTSIRESAFKYCYSLTSVTIPGNVTNIGEQAFYNCTSLENVTLQYGVKTIGEYAFHYCNKLSNVTIPDSVTKIGNSAFSSCYALTSVTLPANLTTIAHTTFDSCTSLASVTIPASVKYIDYDAFKACTKLADVYYAGSSTDWNAIEIDTGNDSLTSATMNYGIVAPHEHSYTSTITKAATHTEEGVKTFTCSCGDTYTEAIAKIAEHSYIAVVTAPKCLTQGYTTYTCVCGDSYIANYTNALGHSAVKDPAVPAKCTTPGKTEGSHCSRCGLVLVAQTATPATGHTESNWVVSSYATCTTNGYKYKMCTTCGTTLKTETLYATGHTLSGWIVYAEPTCSSNGTKYKKCTTCNEVVERQNISALGHTLSDWIIYEEATCTNNGSKYKKCNTCNEVVESQTISATGHALVIDAGTPATCTEAGKTNGAHCSVCGDVIEAQLIIPAKGHTFSVWTVTKKATVYEKGSKQRKCADCGLIEKANIPQLKCAKPTLNKVANDNTYIKISWSGVKGADIYRIYRKVGTGDYKYIGSTKGKYYNDKNVASGKTYRYIVRAKNEAGYSEASASLAIKHLDEPKLKSISNTSTGVKITWGKVRAAEKYNVYRKTSGGSYKYIGATSKTSYIDKTAKSGTKYYYAIRAKRAESVSSLSASLSKLYLADPTLKAPSSTKSGVVLKWSKVTGAEGYVIYRKTGSGSYTKLKTEKGVSNLSYTDKSAKKGKKYTYKVKAYKGSTYSAYSNTKAITDKY